MLSLVDFLERLGRSSGPMSATDLATLVAERSRNERELLLAGDVEALRLLCGARLSLACAVAAPDQAPDEEPEEPAEAPDEQEYRAA